jgi:hypothetical protein
MWRWFIEMHDEPFSYVNETLEEDRKLTALETYSPCPCAFQGAYRFVVELEDHAS